MHKSSKPRFSVVIPTKERAYTLKYTVETCLAQSFDNYEIVVCDNFSSPETRQVVESFGSSRIVYVRSDTPLAMSDNWELALANATGEYVIVVGDDDGLLPYALADIDKVLKQTNAPVLRWERVFYNWPDIAVSEFTVANSLTIPLLRANNTVNGRSLVSKVANGRRPFAMLPMFYNSAVHSSLIQELRSKIGRVFAGRAPDVFSGIVIAYISKSFISIGRPMTISGLSGKSNGVATMSLRNKSSIAQDFYALNLIAGLTSHPTVPDIPTTSVEVATNFQWAKQILFPNDNLLSLDRKQLIMRILNELMSRTTEMEVWQQYLEKIQTSLVDDQNLLSWFNTHYANSRPNFKPTIAVSTPKVGFDGYTHHLNAADFGVTDVMGAAELSAKLLGKMNGTPSFDSFLNLDLKKRLRSAAKILIKGPYA